MKIKYKKLANIITGLSLMGIFSLAPVVMSNVGALECGVLPSEICGLVDKEQDKKEPKGTAVLALLRMIVRIMTAGVAILAIGGLIYGGVLYTSAGPNQGQIARAKDVIRNVIIGIIAFALMFSLLQWLIPGGVF